MLSEMIVDYYRFGHRRWMEVDGLWESLIVKMTHMVPSKRIQIKEALSEIKKIRSTLLKNEWITLQLHFSLGSDLIDIFNLFLLPIKLYTFFNR